MSINAWAILDKKSDLKKLVQKRGYAISKILSDDTLLEDDVYEKLIHELDVDKLDLRLLGIKLNFNSQYKLYRLQLEKKPVLKRIFSTPIFEDIQGSIILTHY